MRDYTKGLKINNNELREFINNTISKSVKKYKIALEKTARELYEEGVMAWFRDGGFPESYITMKGAIKTETRVYSDNKRVTIRASAFISPDEHRVEHTSLYRQRAKYPDIGSPIKFIMEDLQWNQGIIGLPKRTDSKYINDSHPLWENYHYHETTPLRDFMKHKFNWTWKKRFHKHISKIKEG